MKWFRIHHEARTDAKLEALTDAQHRVWFRLMCFASEQSERGEMVGYEDEYLAIMVARGDVELLNETLNRLVLLRIIERTEDGVSFIQWKKRQYDKDSDTPEETRRRKQAQRERDKALLDEDSPVSHNDVTPMSHPVTRPEDRVQSTDTESEIAAADARDSQSAEIAEVTDAELYVVECVQAVPGAAGLAAADIVAELRESILNRGSPVTDELMRSQFQRFRNHWCEKRKSQTGKWRGWRNAVSNWVANIRDGPATSGHNGNTPNDPSKIWMEWAEENYEQDDIRQRNGTVIDLAESKNKRRHG